MLRYLQEGSNYTDGIHAKYCNKKTQRNTFSFGNNSGAREGGTHSHRLFAICMGKPVGPRLRQMVRKIQDWQISIAPESHLPFVQISSIYRKMTAKA